MAPELKKVTYEAAMERAWEILDASDMQEVARKSQVPYDPKRGLFELVFLGTTYQISPSKRTVKTPKGQDTESFLAVLLLHYLCHAKDLEPQKELISFRELDGGDVYYSAFCARAINRITEAFGSEPGRLLVAGAGIGARVGTHGDASVVLFVFPKIPVTVIIWGGDSEVPPSSNMLFDTSIRQHLPTEDVAVIGGYVASALIKSKKSLKKG